MRRNHLTQAPPPRTSEHTKEDEHKWPIAYSYSDTTSDSTFSTEPAGLTPEMGPKYVAPPFVYTEASGGLHMGLYKYNMCNTTCYLLFGEPSPEAGVRYGNSALQGVTTRTIKVGITGIGSTIGLVYSDT